MTELELLEETKKLNQENLELKLRVQELESEISFQKMVEENIASAAVLNSFAAVRIEHLIEANQELRKEVRKLRILLRRRK